MDGRIELTNPEYPEGIELRSIPFNARHGWIGGKPEVPKAEKGTRVIYLGDPELDTNYVEARGRKIEKKNQEIDDYYKDIFIHLIQPKDPFLMGQPIVIQGVLSTKNEKATLRFNPHGDIEPIISPDGFSHYTRIELSSIEQHSPRTAGQKPVSSEKLPSLRRYEL
ncbi:MAG: hypothetical protein AAF571_02895 [Verrucomicrobiota bacterium]